MTVIDLKTGLETKITPDMTISCAIGNFDGVHIGHAALLREAAKKDGCTHGAAWTFRVHPRICMNDPDTTILTSLDQKLDLFAAAGLELAILEDFFDVRFLSPDAFVSELLYNDCRVRRAICGYNFRFGKNASGSVGNFIHLFNALGVDARSLSPVNTELGEDVSSSLIRQRIEAGDVAGAARLLGHPFQIRLPVTEGRKLGRRIGIPTINQIFPANYAIPKFGVYACRCIVDGEYHVGVSNVGLRPTVIEHADSINCETHIIDYSGWLYGKTVSVDFYEFIRPEKKFGSLDALVSAIHSDMDRVIDYFK